MKELKFTTNIKCMGCVSKVKPFLDNESKIDSWKVDLEHPDRILTIRTDALEAEDISKLIRNAGYIANEIKVEKSDEEVQNSHIICSNIYLIYNGFLFSGKPKEVPIDIIKDIMRHSSIDVTMKAYRKQDTTRMKEQLKKLDR